MLGSGFSRIKAQVSISSTVSLPANRRGLLFVVLGAVLLLLIGGGLWYARTQMSGHAPEGHTANDGSEVA